jgi:hypothetical protein
MRCSPVALVLLLSFLSCALYAQTSDTATIQGNVMDAAQAGVPGAHLVITNELTGLVRQTVSNEAGRFFLTGLPAAGEYEVRVTKDGFAAATEDHVSLAGGSRAIFRLTLRVSGETSTVIVEGASEDVRVDQPQLGTDLTGPQMLEVPLPNRRITFLPLLNAANRPAINQGDIFMNENLFTTTCGAGRLSSRISR